MGHIIDSTYIYGTFFAVIPYVKVTHDYLPQRWFGYNPRIIKLRATTKQKYLCSVSSVICTYYCAVVFRTWFSYTSCTMAYQFYSSP